MKKGSEKKGIIKAIAVVVLFAAVSLVYWVADDHVARANSSGSPTSHTGAPGENTCISCHSAFPLNGGPGNIQITGIPASYSPGQEIPVTVTVTDINAVIYGFQITAVDKLGARAGTFQVPATFPPKTQIEIGIVGNEPRQYVNQTVDGLFSDGVFGSNSWTFTWTAPMEPIGKVDFYAAGNASDSNGMTSGDQIYTTSTSSIPAAVFVTVSGTVLSDAGIGLKGTTVILTDSKGMQRSVTTSTFGNFSFSDVESGRTYSLTVYSKRYRFPRQVINVTDNVTNIEFMGLD